MEKQDYLDFELRIEKKGQRYQAAVVHSPCGEASYTFRRPFSDLELDNFVLRLGGARRGTRHISTLEMQAARQFGSRLFEAVFCDDVRACFISSQNEAKHRGLGLRLKLRLETPELINLPWEYLYDASLGRFLSLFEDTPVVRYIDVRERIPPLAVKPPLAILVMVSSPTDYPTLDVAREQANLQEALGELADEGMVKLTWVEKATLPALANCLLRGRYHIFHYIGHGGFDEQSQDGVLVLEDEQGRGQWTSGERLAVLLGNQPTMRLVILNACEGARTSRTDPFAGTATNLVRTGRAPAVVAMQFAITDEAAIIFARGFYTALSVGRPVDAAVTQARLAIFASGNAVEWGTPVLYMRAPDGRIFDVASLSLEEREEAARQQPVQLARLYAQALAYLQAQRWAEAIAGFRAVVALDPNYSDPTHGSATTMLARAQQQKYLAELPPPPAGKLRRPPTLPMMLAKGRRAMPFADQVREVEAEYQGLKGQVGAGVLTEAECKAKLDAMMIEDEQGRWWAIGYETGQWYRHDGEKWVGPELPPVAERPRPEPQPVPTPRGIKPIWIGGGIGALVLLVVLVVALPRLGWFGGPAAIPTPSPTATQPTKTLVLPMATPAPLLTATLVPPTTTSVPPAATQVTPTATSIPPTATQVPPTATPVPPTATRVLPTTSPPPGSYGVPLLVAPANGQEFSEATQAIELSWQAVGHLATDEFYDVYLTWRAGGKQVEKHWYRQETRFAVGREYFGLSDDGRYEWNAVVRRGQSPDAVQLSPISEQRLFLWRPAPPPTWTPRPTWTPLP